MHLVRTTVEVVEPDEVYNVPVLVASRIPNRVARYWSTVLQSGFVYFHEKIRKTALKKILLVKCPFKERSCFSGSKTTGI
jgi:hypothetical protein